MCTWELGAGSKAVKGGTVYDKISPCYIFKSIFSILSVVLTGFDLSPQNWHAFCDEKGVQFFFIAFGEEKRAPMPHKKNRLRRKLLRPIFFRCGKPQHSDPPLLRVSRFARDLCDPATAQQLTRTLEYTSTHQICQETVSQGQTSTGQRCKSEFYTLKPSSLASVKEKQWENAVSQRVKVPSLDIFVYKYEYTSTPVRTST